MGSKASKQTAQARGLLRLSMSFTEPNSIAPVPTSWVVFMTCVVVGHKPREQMTALET